MTKADMETDQAEYYALVARARAAQREGRYREAVELAVSSWDHIDGMMRYERKYADKQFVSIEGIEVVLRYAPLLFDFDSLNGLEALLRSQRRIEKNTSGGLADKLSKARGLMWDAHRLWVHLEEHVEVRQDELRRALQGDQERWRAVAEAWDTMELIRRTPEGGSYRLSLITRMDERVLAKCSSCGVVAKASKIKFLGAVECPKCGATAMFVILARRPGMSA
ncbi:MAG: hypothetical protein WD847_07365 [Pirellulales bacterium]